MHRIKIISHFSGAHSLRHYKGKCEALHGHNWKVEVVVAAANLNAAGMVMDFSELKKITKDILGDLDHKHLNELDYFKKHNPSSEQICRYIFDRLEATITAKNCILYEVRVWETENSCAAYRK